MSENSSQATAVSSYSIVAPTKTLTSQDKYQSMIWICQFCGSQVNYTKMIEKYHGLITDLSFEDYYLASNETFQSLGLNLPLQLAHRYHLSTFPMIASHLPGEMHILFTNSSVQSAFISSAVKAALTNDFTGYNIDFEVPYYSDSHAVTEFVENFSNALLAVGKELTIDVPGVTGLFSPSVHGAAYNYSALAKTSVSLIVVMDYFSIGDFYNAVNYSVANVPLNKLMIALPDYSYSFYVNVTSNCPFPNNLVPPYVNHSFKGMYGALKSILHNARKDHAKISNHFSSFYGEPYYEIIYPQNKTLGVEFYYINNKAMSLRLNYLEKLNIDMVAMWRAGAVDPNLFSSVKMFYVHTAIHALEETVFQMVLNIENNYPMMMSSRESF
ncbi:MAG: hypothetical protein M1327_05985 [Candidatus Thermoplasmatota archaeon]|nr:hypothetical protein [Candidatus Thermoplasmatota archaeon]